MEHTSDFYPNAPLTVIYEVPNSQLGMQVAVCEKTGLLHSIATKEKDTRAVKTTSSDANWGNIRHGKGLRLKAGENILNSEIPWDQITHALDIGANRGDFVMWLHNKKPQLPIVGIEPDERVIDAYEGMENFTLKLTKLEKAELENESFDFIYNSHTLEHADSAAEMIETMSDLLKIGGYAFLEVPNADIMMEDDIVEEFFIDKHRFHFNRKPLVDYCEFIGFEIVYGKNDTDVSNITLVLKKVTQRDPEAKFAVENPELVIHNKESIKKYEATLTKNREKLKAVAAKLDTFMDRQKVAFWGGGRIFDALVRYGGLHAEKAACVIDRYLADKIDQVHNVKLQKPEAIKMVDPQVVVILAKSSTDEIYQEVRNSGVRHVIKFEDLILN